MSSLSGVTRSRTSRARPRTTRPRTAVALAITAAVTMVASGTAPLTWAAPATNSGRQQVFAAAAAEFGVPQSVLLGVSYLESRWDANAGQPSRGAGFGPMHLTDAASLEVGTPGEGHHGDSTEDPRGDTARPLQLAEPSKGPAPESLQTIDLAAKLLDTDRATLRADPKQNIRGGAAILAQYQRELGQHGSGPGAWYGAVARYSGAADTASARRFADDVFGLIREGQARTTDDGHQVTLQADPAVKPEASQVDRLGLRPAKPGEAECPDDLGCEWIPAPYQLNNPQNLEKYGNHDKADRPNNLKIKYIIIHDTEGSYATTLKLVQDPKYVSWQYTLRSADGHIAQHVKHKDVAWQAGNWYINSHSIGLEHEGFAAKGTWYTEAMYRTSSRLVRYLARKYDVPLDRQHILGHDNVPGVGPDNVKGMHWDPGPYWDWGHYFDLLKAPLRSNGGPHSGIVTIKPDYATNHPLMTGCDPKNPTLPCPERGTNSVYLHSEPRHDAPLVKDPGVHPDGSPSTRVISDMSGRVDTGQQYAVAGRSGDWTAIWYLGQKGWFHNPAAKPTALNNTGWVVTPKPGRAEVSVYGVAYPEEAAYQGTGVPPQPLKPLQYSLHAKEQYVLADQPWANQTTTDYYFAKTWEGPRVVVRGNIRYYEIQFGHRVAFVNAADVWVLPSFL